MANPTCLPATEVTSTSGVINGSADNIPPTQFIRVAYSMVAGGPYLPGVSDPGTNTLDQQTNLAVSPLAPGTTVFYVLQELDTDGTTVLATSAECSFTTSLAPADSFVPMPCTNCGGDSGGAEPVHQDVEPVLLCDFDVDGNIVGSALAVYAYADDTGLPVGPPTFVIPGTNDPYVPVGTLRPCEQNTAGTAQVYADCGDVPREAIVSGPNLIDNGDFADSEGFGSTSTIGPGFASQYCIVGDPTPPCNRPPGDNLFGPEGSAGAMAYFTTNAGQVTGGDAVTIPALTTKSLAVNVGPDVNQAIISWQVPLINGQTYELGADVAIIYPPYDVKLTIDDVDVLALTAPSMVRQWQRRNDQFVWTGTTGLHTLALKSNSAAFGGNDHTFDNFTLRRVNPAQIGVLSECEYDSRVRACIEQIVQTTGCNDDRRDSILASIAASGGSVANDIESVPICVDGETWAQVSMYETGAGSVVSTTYFGPNGALESEPAVFLQGPCQPGQTLGPVCYVTDPPTGQRTGFLALGPDGTPVLYSATGAVVPDGTFTIVICPEITQQSHILCDAGNADHQFLRWYVDSPIAGQSDQQWDFELDGSTPYVPVGPVAACSSEPDTCTNSATVLLCDAPADSTTTITPDIADSTSATVGQGQFANLPGAYTALWTGGVLNYPADAGPAQNHRAATGRLTADVTGCETATGTWDVSVRITQLGPGTGQLWDGALRLFRGTTLIADVPAQLYAPPGYQATLSASVPVTAADLAAGDLYVMLALETFHGTAKAWNADQFTSTVELTGCTDTQSVQFLRTLVTDCETGAIVAQSDTTLDGDPYVVTGTVENCQASTPEGCRDCESLVLCDVPDVGEPVAFLRTVCRTCDGTSVTTVDTLLDGTTTYTPTGVVGSCAGGADSVCTTQSSIGTVCYTPPAAPAQVIGDDWNGATLAGNVITNSNFAGQGITVTDTTNGVGTMTRGGPVNAYGVTTPAVQHHTINLGGPRTNVTLNFRFFGSTGGERFTNITPAPTVVTGNGVGSAGNTIVTGGPATDGNMALFFPGPVTSIDFDNAPTGGGSGIQQAEIQFTTAAQPGDIAQAAVLRDCETGALTYVDLETGTEITPGVNFAIVECPSEADCGCPPTAAEIAAAQVLDDAEVIVLCDSTPTRFLRKYLYDKTGAFVSVTNTTLDGTTPFAPVGAVGICTTPVLSDFDFAEEVLCDANGTQFIRRFRFNSQTGVLDTTTNVTLAGAAFVPVGAVSVCTSCCPIEIGNGCLTGGRFYTALRLPNGTVSLINSVTGAVVLAADIIPCVSDDTVITQTAEARLLAAGQSWTPGADVVGTLTGLTMQVITGTGSLVDANGTAVAALPAGTSVSWNVEDNNTLTGPQSITADAVSTVLVNWTRK